MTDEPDNEIEPRLQTAHSLHVRRADQDLNTVANWIARTLRDHPGTLIDTAVDDDDTNHIHIKIERRNSRQHA